MHEFDTADGVGVRRQNARVAGSRVGHRDVAGRFRSAPQHEGDGHVDAEVLPAGGQSVTDVGNRKHWIDTRADAGGMFRLCGVPVDNPISLSAGDGAGGAPVIVRIPGATAALLARNLSSPVAGTASSPRF